MGPHQDRNTGDKLLVLLLGPLAVRVHEEVRVPGPHPALHLPDLPHPSLLGGLVLPNFEAMGFVREVLLAVIVLLLS